MQKDIGETTDLAAKHPEVVAQLTKQFSNWIKQQKSPARFPMEQFEKLKAVSKER